MSVQRTISALTIAIVSSAVAIVTATAQQPSNDQKRVSDSETVTVTGCVQPETAVLKRNPALGSVGMGDEFVVTQATLNPGAGTEMPKPDVQTPQTTGTPATGLGRVYRLTGPQEKDLKSSVGQRVEIVGHFKDKEKLKDELGSVGTSGRTGDLTTDNTAEIVIDSFKATSGTCPSIPK